MLARNAVKRQQCRASGINDGIEWLEEKRLAPLEPAPQAHVQFVENVGLKRIKHGGPYGPGLQEDEAGCVQAVEVQLYSRKQEERLQDAPP